MRVYTYGVWDLFHLGHLKVLKQAKSLGNELIVGVFTDKIAESFKRKPIMNEKERFNTLSELGIGTVVLQKSFLPDEKMLNKFGVRLVAKAEGAGWDKDNIPKFKNIETKLLKYTKGISTSDLIKRCYDYQQQLIRKNADTKRCDNKS